MFIEILSSEGSKPNEDDFYIGKNLFVIMDGATPLQKKRVKSSNSDAEWLVKKTKKILPKLEEIDDLRILAIRLSKELMVEFYQETGINPYDLSIQDLPSMALTLVRVDKGNIKVLSFGDTVYSIYTSGKYHTYCGDEKQRELEYVNSKLMRKYVREFGNINDAREKIKKKLIEDRKQAGIIFTTFVPLPEFVEDEIIGNRVHYREIKNRSKEIEILLATDGFGSLVDTFKVFSSMSELHEFVREEGVRSLYKLLKLKTINDPELQVYPRMKLIDDASIVFVRL